MKFWSKLRFLFRKEKLDAEMSEEMQLHLELQAERNVAAGMDPDEARFAARRQFGGVEQIKEQVRDQRGGRWAGELAADFRFALRMLRKHPGFTAAAVLTLALGIGLVTTLFTMTKGAAFGQLPFEDAQRIVSIDVPAAQFDDYAARQESCEAFAFAHPIAANLRAETFVSRYRAAIVSADFLGVLRIRPVVGRGFLPHDAAAAAAPTALIGAAVAEREFGDQAAAVGREIQINGETHTVLGVMAAGFGFPFNQEVWIPRRSGEPVEGGLVFGRLRSDVRLRSAAAQFSAIAQNLTPTSVDASGPLASVSVVPFAERNVKDALRIMLSAILCVTFLVLLLACANVANLILARAIDRRKELAVRAAMGASRGRLIRQMLTESFLVAAMGAAGGLAIATWSTAALWRYVLSERSLTGGGPFWVNFDVDGRVFGFVAAVSLLVSVATGLVPALQASRIDLNQALKDGAGAGQRSSRVTRFLVNVQTAFSVCLVTVAGLFVTVLVAFNHKTLPYDPAAIFTGRVSLEERRYDDAAVRRRFFEELVSRLSRAPGVDAAALNSAESLRIVREVRIELEGAIYGREADRPRSAVETVSPNFLEGFGVGRLQGRTFTAADQGDAPAVAVVNAAFAERFSPGRSVIGRRFRPAGGGGAETDAWITVVGVAPDLGSMKAGQTSRGPVIYRPLAQESERGMTILVRGRGEVARFAVTIRREVAALDPGLPVAQLQSVQEIVALERIGMNAFGVLFVVCGAGALLLASVGIYGVISFAVKLRTREFGVRMALGADRGAITRLVLGEGVRHLSLGLAIGVLLAIAAAVGLSALFLGFGRSAYDPWIYLGTVVLLATVGGGALLIPARRAARVDPMVALRAE